MIPIASMTGFGRAENANEHYHTTIELHSINKKQSEILIHLPKQLIQLEHKIRKQILVKIKRGRVQCNVQLKPLETVAIKNTLDINRLQQLIKANQELANYTGQEHKINLQNVLEAGNIIQLESESYDENAAWDAIAPSLEKALIALCQMRKQEGDHLKKDILARLKTLLQFVQTLKNKAPEVVTQYRNQLLQRLENMDLSIDLQDERLVKEIALFADKSDISEELTRLDSHFLQFHSYLEKGCEIGRSLDFLCQEIQRELNTIGAKANHAELAQSVVQAKTELEKVREQVQNIE